MTPIPDPPVEMPEDYPCKYERACQDCDARGTPACPLFTCQDCDDERPCEGCPNNEKV